MTNGEQTERDELLEDLDTQAAEDGDIAARAAAALIRAQAARISELERQVEKEREENRWAYVNAALEDSTTQARNDALREAAGVCQEYSKDHGAGMFDVHSAECERRILALIKEPTT